MHLPARAEALLAECGGRQPGCGSTARDHDMGGTVNGGHWWRHPGGDANSVVSLSSLLTNVLLVNLLLYQG